MSLVAFSRDLLQEGIQQSFPIRGAITRGDVSWGKLTYGRAVIEAHNIEQSQNWVGVTCGAFGVPRCAWSIDDGLVCYPTPSKSSMPIMCHGVVAWDIPPSQDLANLLTWGNLTVKGEVMTWAMGEKVNNTTLFGLYLKMLGKHRPDPSKYYGLLPVTPIEALIVGLAKPI